MDTRFPSPQRVREVTEKFEALGCAQLWDASAQHVRRIDRPFRPRGRAWKLAGPAFPVTTDCDLLPCIQALDAAAPGAVLYVHDRSSSGLAVGGDIFALAAKLQGLAGIIVDGAIRDIDGLAEIGLPVFSTATNFMAAKDVQMRAEALPGTIALGDETLCGGDWLFADSDGVCWVPRRAVGPVIAGAVLLQERERALRDALRDGERFGELCGLEDYLAGRAPLRAQV